MLCLYDREVVDCLVWMVVLVDRAYLAYLARKVNRELVGRGRKVSLDRLVLMDLMVHLVGEARKAYQARFHALLPRWRVFAFYIHQYI